MAISSTEFRRLLSHFATGVTIVTTRSGDVVHGMTVNAFCSVSLEPPLVLFCADHKTRTYELVKASGIFAVNILTTAQQDLSDRFGGKIGDDEDRFVGLAYTDGPTGSPLIADCLAYLDCRVVAAHPAGDHTIFVGEVVWGRVNQAIPDGPLLFYRSRYERLETPDLAATPRDRRTP